MGPWQPGHCRTAGPPSTIFAADGQHSRTRSLNRQVLADFDVIIGRTTIQSDRLTSQSRIECDRFNLSGCSVRRSATSAHGSRRTVIKPVNT